MLKFFGSKSSDEVVSVKEDESLYLNGRKFIPFLPMIEYQSDSGTFLFDDEKSVGVAYEIKPIPIDGRTQDFMESIRDKIENGFQNAFDEDDTAPWVLAQYSYDEVDLEGYIDHMEVYASEAAKGSQLTEEYTRVMRQHYKGIAKKEGIFYDEITQTRWRGRVRKSFIVIYRYLPEKYVSKTKKTPEEEINDVCGRFERALLPAGVKFKRLGGKAFYEWMLPWFNPNPKMKTTDKRDFYKTAKYPDDDALPYGSDFTANMFFSRPRSDADTGTWFFDDLPHRFIRINRLRNKPEIGAMTGEITFGQAKYNFMDHLPPGAILVNVMVVEGQDKVENQVNAVQKRATGETGESERTEKDCAEIKSLMGDKHKLYRGFMGVYVRAETEKQLDNLSGEVCSLLLNFDMHPVYQHEDDVALDTYILGLPFSYNPLKDKHIKLAKLTWVQHIANLSGFFGRGTGTGNPCFNFFNRGAEPLSFDPFNMADRKTNGHGLILGPTGSGKSALVVTIAIAIMAMIKPRLYIVEVGNSFGLLGDYFASMGLKVNKVKLAPGCGVHIPPFADSHLLIENELETENEEALLEPIDISSIDGETINDEDDDEGDEQRDVLGEMELLAILMITGGNENDYKNFSRPDRRLVRNAILTSSKLAYDESRQCMTGDVRDAMFEFSKDKELRDNKRERAEDMADALSMFCDGFEGDLFNKPGSSWPDADVTIIDLATFAREGYEPQLAVAYSSLMMKINNIAEKYQHDERPLIQITDEGHIITTNPLLSPFIVKVVKMWRKLGAWWWVATQNLEDFPDISKKLLNMVEWWICLVMPKEEVEQISRFRDLNNEQKAMFIDARKEPGKYTEGVVLSKQLETLFKNVPASLYLALAMTEKDEKSQRMRLMKEHGITELEAVYMVAEQLDKARGIIE